VVSQRKGGAYMDIPPMGVEMGQLAKKRGGGKRNGWIASSLATNETSQKF